MKVFKLLALVFLATLIACGGGGSDDSLSDELTTEEFGVEERVNVQGEWFGRAFVNTVDCDTMAEAEDFDFDFGVFQSGDNVGDSVLVSYEPFCDDSQDESGVVTADGFQSQIVKTLGCAGGIDGTRVDSTTLNNVDSNAPTVTIVIESVCPEFTCRREWEAQVTRSSEEQFICQ